MIDPMFSNGRWWLVIPGLLGILMFARFFKNYHWVSRIPLAFVIGTTAGVFLLSELHGKVLPQVQSTMRSFNPAAGFGSVLLSLIIVVGVVTTLIYFYFSKEHKGLLGGTAKVGIWFIMISFGISVILVLPRICDMFAERSEWLQKNLKKIETVTQKSEMFRKYGMYTFIPFIWVPGVGLYGCVMIAWLFKWRGVRAGAIILAGWILAALIVLLTSIGIFSIIQ